MVLLNPPDALTWESHLCFSGNFPLPCLMTAEYSAGQAPRPRQALRPLIRFKSSSLQPLLSSNFRAIPWPLKIFVANGITQESGTNPQKRKVPFISLSGICHRVCLQFLAQWDGVVIEICPMTKFLGPFAIIYQWWNFPWPWLSTPQVVPAHQGTSARPLATLRFYHMRWLQNCSWSHQADSAGGSSLLSWIIFMENDCPARG